MILVTHHGGTLNDTFPWLKHAEWHGVTVADFVYPCFLWIIGVAMIFSFAKRIERNADKQVLLVQVLCRSTALFGLGLLVTNASLNFRLETIRMTGILQQIALCYLLGAVIVLYTSRDMLIYWIMGLLTLYWMQMTLIPVPDYGPGELTPDGNFARYVDALLIGSRQGPYADTPSVLPMVSAITLILVGALVGGWMIRNDLSPHTKILWGGVKAVTCLSLALLLMDWIPVIKKLWTPSFVLLTSGVASLVFVLLYWIIDLMKHTIWCKPLVIFGTNATILYAVSILVANLSSEIGIRYVLHAKVFSMIAQPMVASLLYGLIVLSGMYIFSRFLYMRRWFVRF
jgi:predicted acyltransferase